MGLVDVINLKKQFSKKRGGVDPVFWKDFVLRKMLLERLKQKWSASVKSMDDALFVAKMRLFRFIGER